MRHQLLCVLAPCLLQLGCNAHPKVAQAADDARPHLAAFARFDRWARRAGVREHFAIDRDAIGETTFAPIRGDKQIAAAWVAFEGRHGFALAFPAGAKQPQVAWVALRDADLGSLRVAAIEHCGELLQHATHALASQHCVLISRSAEPPAPDAITVTLAFENLVQ